MCLSQVLKNGGCTRRLLMLAYYFPPMNASGAQRPFRFAKYLRRSGIDSRVISAAEAHGESLISGNRVGGGSVLWSDRVARAVQRVLPYNDQLPWVPRAVRMAQEAIAEQDGFSCVLSTSPPLATHVAAFLLKRRHGVKWIADLRDPITGNPFRQDRFGAAGWDELVEGCVIRYADAVIGNTATVVANLQKKHPKQTRKIHLIWNGYDPEEEFVVRSVSDRPWRTMTHAGNLYGGRHPGQLIEAVSRLTKRGALNPDRLRIRLLGYLDPEAPWIAKYDFAKFRNVPWLEVVGQVPRSDAHEAMTESDYLLLLDLNEQGSGLQVPGKLFEYLRIGRPILAFTNEGSQTEFILDRSGIPHVCIYPTLSGEETDRRLLSFLQLSPEPATPSEWFQQVFDGSRQAQALASILKDLN